MTTTQTIRKKKANQQNYHAFIALFDPNWLKTDLVIQDLTIVASLAFHVEFKMGGTIPVAVWLWKESHFTLA